MLSRWRGGSRKERKEQILARTPPQPTYLLFEIISLNFLTTKLLRMSCERSLTDWSPRLASLGLGETCSVFKVLRTPL